MEVDVGAASAGIPNGHQVSTADNNNNCTSEVAPAPQPTPPAVPQQAPQQQQPEAMVTDVTPVKPEDAGVVVVAKAESDEDLEGLAAAVRHRDAYGEPKKRKLVELGSSLEQQPGSLPAGGSPSVKEEGEANNKRDQMKIEYFRTIQLSSADMAPGMALSREGMGVSSRKGFRSVRTNFGFECGTYVCEISVERLGETGHARLGFATKQNELQAPVGFDAFGYGYRDVDGSKVHQAKLHEFGEAFKEGDVIGMVLHLPKPKEEEVEEKKEGEKSAETSAAKSATAPVGAAAEKKAEAPPSKPLSPRAQAVAAMAAPAPAATASKEGKVMGKVVFLRDDFIPATVGTTVVKPEPEEKEKKKGGEEAPPAPAAPTPAPATDSAATATPAPAAPAATTAAATDGPDSSTRGIIEGSKILFFKNGVCQGVAFSDLLKGKYFPCASLFTLPSEKEPASVVFNFGQTPLSRDYNDLLAKATGALADEDLRTKLSKDLQTMYSAHKL